MHVRPFTLLLLLFILVLSILFFVGGPTHQSARSFQELWNIGHILYYSLFPVLILRISRITELETTWNQVILAFAPAVILGLIVEFLQHGLGRSPDIGDLFRNVIGAAVAVFFLLPVKNSIQTPTLHICRVITLVLIGVQLIPTGAALLDEYQARQEFPILSDFESSLELTRWGGKAVKTIRSEPGTPDNKVMQVQLSTEKYSGFSLDYFPTNWRGYTALQFRLFNTRDSILEIHIRVHDKQHDISKEKMISDRFHTTLLVGTGWNSLSIQLSDILNGPQGRQIDLEKIESVGIFVSSQAEPLTIYLDDVMLR